MDLQLSDNEEEGSLTTPFSTVQALSKWAALKDVGFGTKT